MLNWRAKLIHVQIAFSDVGLAIAAVYEHVIPGLILWRSAQCNGIVPLFRPLKICIHVNHDTAIIE